MEYRVKRLDYLDYTKGLCILLVVLGHIYDSSNILRIWIYSFHMPLFFIISGMLVKHTNVKERSIKNIIISKFKTLIVPYIFLELIAIFVWMITNEFTLQSLKWNIMDSILMYCRAGATWFLPCLFIAEVVFILMVKYIKNDKINILISLLIFVIPFIVKTDNHYLIVIMRCFTAYGYITFGYLFYNFIVDREITFKYLTLFLIFNFRVIK